MVLVLDDKGGRSVNPKAITVDDVTQAETQPSHEEEKNLGPYELESNAVVSMPSSVNLDDRFPS